MSCGTEAGEGQRAKEWDWGTSAAPYRLKPSRQDREQAGQDHSCAGEGSAPGADPGRSLHGEMCYGDGAMPCVGASHSQSSRARGPILGKHHPTALLQAGTGVQQCPAPGTRPAGGIRGSYRTAPSFRPSPLFREEPDSRHPAIHSSKLPSPRPEQMSLKRRC